MLSNVLFIHHLTLALCQEVSHEGTSLQQSMQRTSRYALVYPQDSPIPGDLFLGVKLYI
jgi:hypothetical protein